MSPRSIGLSDELNSYVIDHSSPPSEVQQRLIDITAAMPMAMMQIAPEQGEFMAALVALTQPSLVVEVGTFTGYSALSMAGALPDGARIICCDVSEEWTSIGREHWAAAGLTDRIELRLGPAIDTLRAMPADTVIDLAFIDADKGGYADYYEEILGRLAPGGAILVDNTLWSGAVLDDDDDSADTVAIRDFNSMVADDPRTRQVLLPIGDGLTLIRHA
ncbi:MAG: class I SAM-dependent methyltransferase [Actinomycetota bacterium]